MASSPSSKDMSARELLQLAKWTAAQSQMGYADLKLLFEQVSQGPGGQVSWGGVEVNSSMTLTSTVPCTGLCCQLGVLPIYAPQPPNPIHKPSNS